jgi:selenocysteine lyase/cysteine desulfurase
MLGPKRKEDRLRYLNNLWTKPLRNNNKIILNTPDNPKRYAAIANVGIKGISPSELSNILFEKYKIFCVAIDRPGVRGCRITPNVFTSENEIISFKNALLEIAS